MLLALVVLVAPAIAHASVPRPGAELWPASDTFAPLGEDALAGASRDAASLHSLRHELASLAPAVPERDGGFTLFAGDELARVLARDANASHVLTLEPAQVAVHTLASLAPASRAYEQRFSLHLTPDVFGLKSPRGPPDVDEDVHRGADSTRPESSHRGVGTFPGVSHRGAGAAKPGPAMGLRAIWLGTRRGAAPRLMRADVRAC